MTHCSGLMIEWFMKRILFLCFFLVLPIGAPAVHAGTKEDIAQLQRNLMEIQQQFWDLEKRLNEATSLDNRIKSVQDSADELRETQASLNAKLEKVLNEIQVLKENLEETNQRVRDLSVPTVSAVPPADPSGFNGTADTAEPAPAPARTTQPTVSEQQLYQDAMALYTKGRFEQALRSFQDLLDQYPGSGLSDDSQFMIGESYYGMKEYVDAVAEYDKVVKAYPDSDRVPGARLKKAFSLFSLGKKGQGVVELQQITQRYPDTKESEIARQRLEELDLD